MFAVLAAMFVGMWVWKASVEPSAQRTVVPYSTFFSWVDAGKVQSVAMIGEALDGELKAPESVAGVSAKSFHTTLPAQDPALLPLLRSRGARIDVKSRQQPFAVEVIMTLLPWAIILGVWVLLSRRAGKMLAGAGGPAALMKSQSRKFDEI